MARTVIGVLRHAAWFTAASVRLAMTTDVSSRPRGGRGSGKGIGSRVDEGVQILAEAASVYDWSPTEHGDRSLRGNESLPSKWHQLPYRHTVAGDNEALTPVEAAHDLSAVVAQLSLRDLPTHAPSVAPGPRKELSPR